MYGTCSCRTLCCSIPLVHIAPVLFSLASSKLYRECFRNEGSARQSSLIARLSLLHYSNENAKERSRVAAVVTMVGDDCVARVPISRLAPGDERPVTWELFKFTSSTPGGRDQHR